MRGITISDARWLAGNLNRLSDAQLRAANYSPAEIESYLLAVSNKICELNRAVESAIALR